MIWSDDEGYIIRTKSGDFYVLVLLGMLDERTASRFAGMARYHKNSTFTARGYVAQDERGEAYFVPSRCVFIYRMPE